MSKKTKEFKTEVKQLLDLVIHSLYSNKEIFLREIISNASDALDKARFESLTNKNIESDNFRIRIELDKANKAIIIADNGIGMSFEEVETNIGTIARSGTKAFMQQLKDNGQSGELIGQFGVGFYSAFMVADHVKLVTSKAGSTNEAVAWESEGTGEYSIETCTKETQGTEITIYLKEEFEEFLSEWRIQSIVRKFSDYIEYPVILVKEETEGEGDEQKVVATEEIVNSQKAIWTRPKADITNEEYAEFYRHISHDFAEPQKSIHWNVEGNTEFKALVFIPSQQPMDMLMPDRKKGLHLYVKRVFITDECQALLPDYLRFVKGVVDSSDLPLNVSREILQEDRLIRVIEKNIVKKVLDTLKDMKENDGEEYLKFWKNFGRILKEGMHFDFSNKEKIQELMLFETLNNSDGKLISLKEYVDSMPETQEDIYVISGSSREVAMNSPHLEAVRKRGYDVLFMIDSIDPWVLQSLPEYAGKKLKNIAKGEFELGSSEEKEASKKELEAASEKFATLIALLGKILEADVKEVKLSNRLTDSAACLVADENG
ncbi:MAG: molecular chaperone HtpG, partial [Lentisphaeria bacterium]